MRTDIPDVTPGYVGQHTRYYTVWTNPVAFVGITTRPDGTEVVACRTAVCVRNGRAMDCLHAKRVSEVTGIPLAVLDPRQGPRQAQELPLLFAGPEAPGVWVEDEDYERIPQEGGT